MNLPASGAVSPRETSVLDRFRPMVSPAVAQPKTGAAAEVRNFAERPVRDAIEWTLRRLGVDPRHDALWLSTTSAEDVRAADSCLPTAIVNLSQLNNLRRINGFVRVVNSCLPDGGIYVCRMETLNQRWERVFRKYLPLLAYLFYFVTFILHRVVPKLPVTKQLYFAITGGKNRVLSEAEALGRLICCGFTILETQTIERNLFIIARKARATAPAVNPSYGPLFRARRVGRDGKEIRVFKLRTMHPYSEYLQEYVFERNSLATGGKFKDDFRVTEWGRICRKYWIDELPMLINWLKRDLKLVGVRPLSHHYVSLYPEALRTRRLQHRPGLVPPFYADLPSTFEEIVASEEAYLAGYEHQPFRTDFRYFLRAMYNILVRRARSA
jgi:lipopolysaccharide/colanic/teichoic acid biosynthesis glycosyltransferase